MWDAGFHQVSAELMVLVWGATWTARTLSPIAVLVVRVLLTVQSVSSPPTTMCYPRCGEQGLCWLQLKASSSRRTCCL